MKDPWRATGLQSTLLKKSSLWPGRIAAGAAAKSWDATSKKGRQPREHHLISPLDHFLVVLPTRSEGGPLPSVNPPRNAITDLPRGGPLSSCQIWSHWQSRLTITEISVRYNHTSLNNRISQKLRVSLCHPHPPHWAASVLHGSWHVSA